MKCSVPFCDTDLDSQGTFYRCPRRCLTRPRTRQQLCKGCGVIRPIDGPHCRFCGDRFSLHAWPSDLERAQVISLETSEQSAGFGRARCHFAATHDNLFAFDDHGRLSRIRLRGPMAKTKVDSTAFNMSIGSYFGTPVQPHFPIRTRARGAVVWIAIRKALIEVGNGNPNIENSADVRLIWPPPGADFGELVGVPCQLEFTEDDERFVGVTWDERTERSTAYFLRRSGQQLSTLSFADLPSGFWPHFAPIPSGGGVVVLSSNGRVICLNVENGRTLVVRTDVTPSSPLTPWPNDERDDAGVRLEGSGSSVLVRSDLGIPMVMSTNTGALTTSDIIGRQRFAIQGSVSPSNKEWCARESVEFAWENSTSCGAIRRSSENGWNLILD